jgi:hypothetical protein
VEEEDDSQSDRSSVGHGNFPPNAHLLSPR